MILPMSLKRKREDGEREAQPAAKFLITGRVFTCRMCNKEFSTFQALGGHCASHKNPNTVGADRAQGPVTSELHKCKICGEEFPSGQALGGHMTKHRSKQTTDATNCSKSGSIFQEKFRGEESKYDSSMHKTVLVTRDFFLVEPVRVNTVHVDPVPFGDNLRNTWLDLKLGLPGDYKKN